MITIYSKLDCPYCNAAKKLLEHSSIAYTELVLENDDYTREDLVRLLPAGTRVTVPQIFDGEKRIGGYDDLKEHMENHGVFGLQN